MGVRHRLRGPGRRQAYGYAKASDKAKYGKAVAKRHLLPSPTLSGHDGRMMDQNDYRYALALPYNVAVEEGR